MSRWDLGLLESIAPAVLEEASEVESASDNSSSQSAGDSVQVGHSEGVNNPGGPCVCDEWDQPCSNCGDRNICEYCGKQVCALPWWTNVGNQRLIKLPHKFDVCLVDSTRGKRAISSCVNCKRVECLQAKDEQHFFVDRVCVHCGIEQCPYFSLPGVTASLGVHRFVNGQCIFCEHYQCKNGRTHKRSEGNYCEVCGKIMCGDLDVCEEIDAKGRYCESCFGYMRAELDDQLCYEHGKQASRTCCLCGMDIQVEATNPRVRSFGDGPCLCDITQQPHAFVKTDIHSNDRHERYICTTCNEYRCSKSEEAGRYDVHKFDDDGVCCRCGHSRCPRTGDVHRPFPIVRGGLKLYQCADCTQILCSGSGRSHVIQQGKCKFCHAQACDNGNVHVFSGPDGKCMFCPRTKCGETNQCHNPVVGRRGLECEHCSCRICPEAYFSDSRKLTICQDDGDGFCRYCSRGICTYRNGKDQLVSGDHDFDDHGVCRQCDGSLCGYLKDQGYCHKNERGYCVICGKQLCYGNHEHVFVDSPSGSRLCSVCGGEECESRTGFVHCLGVDGCCTFCQFELCTSGKRRHRIHTVTLNKGLTLRVCELCNSEVCAGSFVKDQCHRLDSASKCCIKCHRFLCVRNDQNILAVHSFDDGGICQLCHGERCGESNDIHECGAGFCVRCKHEICKNNRRHHCGSIPMVCELCQNEVCPKSNGGCHRFGRDGRCVLCYGFRCEKYGRVHVFIDADHKQGDHGRKVCVWCRKQQCLKSRDNKDVCHFVSDAHFCINCLQVQCNCSINDSQNEKLYQFTHMRRYLESKTTLSPCAYCGHAASSFEEQCYEADQAMKVLESDKEPEKVEKAQSVICAFASVLNQTFVAMIADNDGVASPLRGDAILVCKRACEFLKAGSKNEEEYLAKLKQFAEEGNPLAVSICDSARKTLETAAKRGHGGSICLFLEKYMKESDIEVCRSYLSLLIRGIGCNDEELDNLIDRVGKCVSKRRDPQMNHLLLEYYLDRHHNRTSYDDQLFDSRALKLFKELELSDYVRISIARREMQNHNPSYQRTLAIRLLDDRSNHTNVCRGAALLAEAAAFARAMGLCLWDIFPSHDDFTLANWMQDSRMAAFYQYKGLEIIENNDLDDVSLTKGFEMLKHAYSCGNSAVWYDLVSMAQDNSPPFIPLLAYKTMIDIYSDQPIDCVDESVSHMRKMMECLNNIYHACDSVTLQSDKEALRDIYQKSVACAERLISRINDYAGLRSTLRSTYSKKFSDMQKEWQEFQIRMSEQRNNEAISSECDLIRRNGGVCHVHLERILNFLETDERSVERCAAYVRCAKEELETPDENIVTQDTWHTLGRVEAVLQFCLPAHPWAAIDASVVKKLKLSMSFTDKPRAGEILKTASKRKTEKESHKKRIDKESKKKEKESHKKKIDQDSQKKRKDKESKKKKTVTEALDRFEGAMKERKERTESISETVRRLDVILQSLDDLTADSP